VPNKGLNQLSNKPKPKKRPQNDEDKSHAFQGYNEFVTRRRRDRRRVFPLIKETYTLVKNVKRVKKSYPDLFKANHIVAPTPEYFSLWCIKPELYRRKAASLTAIQRLRLLVARLSWLIYKQSSEYIVPRAHDFSWHKKSQSWVLPFESLAMYGRKVVKVLIQMINIKVDPPLRLKERRPNGVNYYGAASTEPEGAESEKTLYSTHSSIGDDWGSDCYQSDSALDDPIRNILRKIRECGTHVRGAPGGG
jgi:hypothetical protein